MATVYLEGYDPAWVSVVNKGPPVETIPKPPAPKPKGKNPDPIQFWVPFCCDGCQENIQEALIKLDGVDSVKLEPDSKKVTITGKVKPEDALKEAKKVVRRSEFWLKRKEEGKKSDRLPKKGDSVQVLREQRSEAKQLRTEHSSLQLESRDPVSIQLLVNICSEGCIGRISASLRSLEGVDEVNINAANGKVTITGNVKPEKALKVIKRIKPAATLLPKEEGKKSDRLPKKGDSVQVWREQRSEVKQLRTEHSSLLLVSRDEKRGGPGEEKADLARLKGLLSRRRETEHGPVRREESFLERVYSPVPQPVPALQTTSESNHPGPFVHSAATRNRGPLPSRTPSPSALSPAVRTYAWSASRQNDGDTPYLSSPHYPSQTSSHPRVEMAYPQYDDGIHSDVQATVGHPHPDCNDCASCAPGTSCVEDLIREVEYRRDDGYFLSSEWLIGLEQKQRESLMSIFSRAGYSETYHTDMTTLFARIEDDVQNLIDDSNPLSVVTKSNICYKNSQPFEASEEGDSEEGLNIDHRPGVASSQNSEYLLEKSGDVPIAGTTLKVENSSQATDLLPASATLNDELINVSLEGKGRIYWEFEHQFSPEQQPTTLESFLSALKTSRHHTYAVSTAWLSRLKDHEQKELETTILEVGYTKTHQESNTTTFERIRDDVEMLASNFCNNPTSTSNKTEVATSDTEMQEASGRGGILRNDELKGKLDNEGTRTEPGLATTVDRRPKPDSTRTCVGQLLEVTCRSSSSSSSTSTGPSISSQNLQQRFVRQLCGDSFATLPNQCKGYKLPTMIDKVIRMKAFDFGGTSEYVEVPISLKVNIETIVSCCLRKDEDPQKMRVKFSRIGGEVKNVVATEPNLKGLVLKSIRTNVVACVNRSDRRDGYESINLDLEEEYSQPPRRRVLETFPVSVTGDQTKRLDRVWLALSGRNPESDELNIGSTTVELQCHVVSTCKAQRHGTINGTHVLLFKDPRPVTLEGDIYSSLDQESFFELDVSIGRIDKRAEHVEHIADTE